MARQYSSISVETTLASGISSTATSMTVAAGTGSALLGGVTLAAGNVDQFTVALDPDTTNEEIVFITAVSTDTFTITRARAGTSGVTHSAGATVKHVLTSDDLNAFKASISPVANVGFAGSTSGTTTVQATAVAGTTTLTLPAATDTLVGKATTDTLTNKTISGSSNTISNVSLTTAVTGTLPIANGGTNLTTYTTGDIPYASATNTLAKRAIGTNGQVLTVSGGVPTWATPASSTPTYVGVSASKSSNQSINNSTDTIVTFDVEQFDTDGFHSNSTNTSRFTIPSGKAGKYSINGTCQFADSATGVRSVSFLKNGNLLLEMEQVPAASQGTTRLSGGGVFDLAVSDYVEMRVWQNSGSALDIVGGNSYATTVQVTYLGA